MEAGGVGVNSPEFLQKKIERLKAALEEANVLMDRQVTERDDARAQLDVVKRENEDLMRELEQLRAQGAGAPPEYTEAASEPAGVDPALEHELRDRIAQLEAERDQPRPEPDTGSSENEQALRERADYLQRQLDDARRDLDAARSAADTARAEADTARADASSARADASSARADADAARRESQQAQATIAASARRPMGEPELPAPGPFVSQEVIRDALENDNFVLFCQPVFSLQAERITQYELLLRLRDENGRMVRPFSFLEPADRFGLMAEIDRWVVKHALDLLERDVSGDLRLEVNIAAQSLGDFELTSLIEQQIAMSDLDPGRLILEVSENVAAAHLEEAQRLAKRLRGLGCGFALDDFGSTFASFRHLRDLPINFLKIDGDLVVTVTESRTATLTIKSLVELAKGLGAETIAEYVSDDQTLEFLREQGVGYAQGYRIGRPRPIEEVLSMDGAVHQHQPQPPKRVERPALDSGDADDDTGMGGNEREDFGGHDAGGEQHEHHEQQY
jgi:EAL domain-containing protein (putative c-di-GMP-specific phosphodiesterase class I)